MSLQSMSNVSEEVQTDGYGIKVGLNVHRWPPRTVVLASVTYHWPLTHVSCLLDEICISDIFSVAGYQWRMKFSAKGSAKGKEIQGDTSASLFVESVDCTPKTRGPMAAFSLGIINQEFPERSLWRPCEHGFAQKSADWGFQKMILLKDLIDTNQGFVINNILILGIRF